MHRPFAFAVAALCAACASGPEDQLFAGPRLALSGRILFRGELPTLEASAATRQHDPPVEPRPLFRVTADGGLADAVIEIDDGTPPMPGLEVAMTFNDSGIEPLVAVVPIGGSVVFGTPRPDHGFCLHTRARKNGNANASLGGRTVTLEYDRREIVPVTDDLHPWLQAWIYVTGSLHTVVTDEEGRFRIEGLAAGSYTLRVWHPHAGRGELEIVIPEGGPAEIELELGGPRQRAAASDHRLRQPPAGHPARG
jgi:hypothetical protein